MYRPGVSFSHLYDVTADGRGYFGKDGRIDYRINNLGFRGEDISLEKPQGVRRILCLGDSFTFGEGVREQDAWPQRLGQLLGPGTQVVNAGVQGYDLDHEGLYLLLYGRALKPDAVIIAFFMNDAIPFVETVAHQALLTDAPELSQLSRVSALWRFFERRRATANRTSRYLADLRASFASDRWTQSKGRIPRLRQMADHDGFEIIAMIFPLLYNLDDYPLEHQRAEVRNAFRDSGIEVVDLLEFLRGRNAEDLWVHIVDPHPNELAQRIASESLLQLLDK